MIAYSKINIREDRIVTMKDDRVFLKKKKIIPVVAIMLLLVIVIVVNKLNQGESTHYSIQNSTQVTRSVGQYEEKISIAVQQIMIGTKCNNYETALETLKEIKDAGYDAIEINDFMIHKAGLTVKLMTKFGGMPVGNGGKLDWPSLIEESGLAVISLHSYLNSIEDNPEEVANEAKCFGTDMVVITGMYNFDYSDETQIRELANRLNVAGEELSKYGVKLLYHNHNVEMQKVNEKQTAYEIIVEETDPAYVNFEFDSYWMTDAGVNVPELMEKMGNRIKLWHINDRGCKKTGPYYTPILKEDATELGYGNMDLETLTEIAIENGVEGVILETHQNWINDDPIESIKVSSEFMRKHFRQ